MEGRTRLLSKTVHSKLSCFQTVSLLNIQKRWKGGSLKKFDTNDYPLVIWDKRVPIHLYTNEIEEHAMNQVYALADSDIPVGYVSIMPDVHWGKGSVVGAVFACKDKICPMAVGVDIGCGMTAIRVNGLFKENLSENDLKKIQKGIKQSVPVGKSSHRTALDGANAVLSEISDRHQPSNWLYSQIKHDIVAAQLGTLGGGNHFLEVLYEDITDNHIHNQPSSLKIDHFNNSEMFDDHNSINTNVSDSNEKHNRNNKNKKNNKNSINNNNNNNDDLGGNPTVMTMSNVHNTSALHNHGNISQKRKRNARDNNEWNEKLSNPLSIEEIINNSKSSRHGKNFKKLRRNVLKNVSNSDGTPVWLMLHSGSRRIGNHTAQYHESIGFSKYNDKNQITYKSVKNGQTMTINGKVKAPLAWLPIDSIDGQNYIRDMQWCQEYAYYNRSYMLEAMKRVIYNVTGYECDDSSFINIHHNYCTCEECKYKDPITNQYKSEKLWITRKGATSAKYGQFGIIPGSMATGSYIVQGMGNEESWHSCSHGAGRRMARTDAMRNVTQQEFVAKLEKAGVVCDKDPQLRDEAPQAYKDLTSVIDNQLHGGLIQVRHRLLPLVNVKGF